MLDGGLGGGGGTISLCAVGRRAASDYSRELLARRRRFGGATMESWPLCPRRWCRLRVRAEATATAMSDTVSVSAFVLESWPLAEEVVVVASVVVRALTAMASCPRFLSENGRPSE